MDDQLLHFIRSCKIFSSLDRETCEALLPDFEKLVLAPNEALYYQGDLSGDLYIVISGKLSAILTMASGESKIMGYIEPGEMVGEMGVLTNEPRTVTVKALNDATLIKMTGEKFIELCHKFPSVMFAVIKPLATGTQKVFQMISSEKIARHILIIGANKDTSLEEFSRKLNQALDPASHVVLLSDYDQKFNSAEEIENYLEQEEDPDKPKRMFLFLIKSLKTELAKVATKIFDRAYIVGEYVSAPYIDPIVFEIIKKRESHLKSGTELILIQAGVPNNTTQWLRQGNFSAHHHIRMSMKTDFERLIRFIRGKAIGLVLGGGGTRGWAHMGALKALLEANIPIDAIGGTSIGAIIGACYSMHQNYEETYKRFLDLFQQSRHSTSWRSITWPAISIFDGRKFTEAQKNAFGDTRIEDLWLPYFCVTSNFATNTEVIHREGVLWEKTRASSAIPGLVPPMVMNGELHFDGALLNNLPVDVMRQWVGKKGKIIAIELGGNFQRKAAYNFPPELPFSEAFLSDIHITNRDYKFPPFIDTFIRALLVGSNLRTNQNGLAADLLVSLNLNTYRMLHSNMKKTQKLIELGYQDTVNQLKHFKVK